MLLTTLAFAQGMANVMNNLNYQIVGIMVVMLCLGGLAVILTVSGSIAAAIQNRAKAKAAIPAAVVLPLRGREGRCVGSRSPPCSPSSPQPWTPP